jgi:hypothetical protein
MSFPLPPTGLPAFEPLIRGELWRSWADTGKVFDVEDLRAAVQYLRLKPGTSCRLAVFRNGTRATGEPPLGFLLYLYPDARRARVAYEKISGRPSFPTASPYQHFLDEHAVIAVPFPDDAEIPGLRHFYRDSRLRSALYEVLPECPESEWNLKKKSIRRELLAYKPGRRAVYRVDVRLESRVRAERLDHPLYVRVESRETCRKGLDKLAAIGAAVPERASWRIPRARGAVDERSLTVRDWVEGSCLQDCLADDGPFEDAGAALADLHSLDVDIGPGMSRLAGDELTELGLFLSKPVAAVVHGDFHLGQVVRAPDGTAMIDLDRAGSGHPLGDVGSFLAHLGELGAPVDRWGAFLDGYACRAGSMPDPDKVRIATAAALFRRSVLPFRELVPAWPEQIRRRLERVGALLEGGRR